MITETDIERRARLALAAVEGIALQRTIFHERQVSVDEVLADAERDWQRAHPRLWHLIAARGGSVCCDEQLRFAVLALHGIRSIETEAAPQPATEPTAERSSREAEQGSDDALRGCGRTFARRQRLAALPGHAEAIPGERGALGGRHRRGLRRVGRDRTAVAPMIPVISDQIAGLTRGQVCRIRTEHVLVESCQVRAILVGPAGAFLSVRSKYSGPIAIPVASIVEVDAPPCWSSADPYRFHAVEN